MTGSHRLLSPAPGVVLGGRYELTEQIAVGGMGEVWQALDRRLGRTVAAKVLRTELAGREQFLARLRAEARNTAGLRHPNVAALLDHGEQDGSGYLVMELVVGTTLADRIEGGATVPVAELVPVLAQVCRGLHAAHTAGIVHRDVKPANVLVAADGTAKLTDFGISLGARQAPLTAAGMVMGTAQYLAPEQARGRSASPAGDLYAVGVLAYECLAGRRPFTGETAVDIVFAHVNEPVPPLPAAVPAALGAVITRLLAKDPEDRPLHALAAAEELEATLRTGRGAGAPADGRAGPPGGAVVRPRRDRAPDGTSPAAQARARIGHPDEARPRDGGRRTRGRWSLPSWAELAADRTWLVAFTVLLVVLGLLVGAALGTLTQTDPAGAAPAGHASTTKDA